MRRLSDFQEILELTGILLRKIKESVTFTYMEKSVKSKLASFGVALDGHRNSDIQVLSSDFYQSFHEGKFLFGLETGYVNGLWTTADLRACLKNLLSAEMIFGEVMSTKSWPCKIWFKKVLSKVFAWPDVRMEKIKEDEIDPEFYEVILDPYMSLNSGYWETARDLNSAQNDKMNLVATKLKISAGMTVLVIGSGFGGLCNYLAFNYQVRVVGVTNSESQINYARRFCSGSKVCFRLMEYDCLFLTEKFDCIISTEQLQVQDHRKFLTSIGKYLKDDGLFLFETPGAQSCNSNLEFLTNSSTIHVPTNTLDFSLESIPDLFVIEEIENFGEHFYKTFEAWIDKLEKNSSDLKRVYGENTIRKFKFSYVCNAEGFRMAKFQWWQILLSKKHKEGVHSCSFSELFDEDFL